ncbi:hypothetical protein [uncultured Hymenobacter sp.]|uniref:hypothetical protein n=1 Tax=uncultured Hymenobacter sp. TaxID=170016 RepID=UPI0035CB90E7
MKKSWSVLVLLSLLLGLGSSALSGCAPRTAQQKKTQRYQRQHKPGGRIPCPTHDC